MQFFGLRTKTLHFGWGDTVVPSTSYREYKITIADGMIPKIEGCLSTLDQGVKKIHIIDGRLRHSLLLEIYTTSGVGTELVADSVTDATRHHPEVIPAG